MSQPLFEINEIDSGIVNTLVLGSLPSGFSGFAAPDDCNPPAKHPKRLTWLPRRRSGKRADQVETLVSTLF